jgi:uncharacterized protein
VEQWLQNALHLCYAFRVQLQRIIIFPIKSLDGIDVSEAKITERGILEHDRTYAIFDADGKVVNGKRTAKVHELRSEFDARIKEIRIRTTGAPEQFSLAEPAALDRWLSEYFEFEVHLKYEAHTGFPDDLTAFGPTIVSEASLCTVQEWYPGLSLESARRRFRTNLELSGPPFCEDQLYGAPGELLPFQVGEVNFNGHNPCQRCVVPTRDPVSGEGIAGFQKKFMELRRAALPKWANAERFNHYYRFAVNTSIPAAEAGKRLRLGDSVIF